MAFTEGNFTNGTAKVEKQDATAATFEATISVGEEAEAKSVAGKIKVKVGESTEVDVDIEADKLADEVAAAIAKAFENNADYAASVEKATITFTAKTAGVKSGDDLTVTITKAEEATDTKVIVSGDVTFTNGKDEVAVKEATAATYTFTTSGATHAGTILVTVGTEEAVEVTVVEGADANAVAQAIVEAFKNNANYTVVAEGAKVTFTAKTAGSVTDFTVTAKDK